MKARWLALVSLARTILLRSLKVWLMDSDKVLCMECRIITGELVVFLALVIEADILLSSDRSKASTLLLLARVSVITLAFLLSSFFFVSMAFSSLQDKKSN